MITIPNFRQTCLLIFLGCAGLLVIAIYIEPFASMTPCPMCMMQRAVFAALALITLIAAIHHPQALGRKVYLAVTSLIAVGGAAIASRQVWLQHLPEDQVPACGPGLAYMMEVFPLLEVIEMALVGTGDCAKVEWSLFGLSVAGWSLLAFIAIAALCLLVLRNKNTINLNN